MHGRKQHFYNFLISKRNLKIVNKERERNSKRDKILSYKYTMNVIAILKESLSYESVRLRGVASHACSPSFSDEGWFQVRG